YLANGYAVGTPYYEDKVYDGREIHIARVPTRDAEAREPVSYWMRVGNRLVTTNMDRQLAKLMDGLRGIIPDGVLVRVSTRTTSADLAADYAVQDRFIADVLANIDPKTEELLIGPGTAAKAVAARAGG
ncbi:MAG TPA: EpsI family protein, partial [Alphaproteobacteria bacterium]|nr:EpsI family protein [Alphaproteobacteria bacterium]